MALTRERHKGPGNHHHRPFARKNVLSRLLGELEGPIFNIHFRNQLHNAGLAYSAESDERHDIQH